MSGDIRKNISVRVISLDDGICVTLNGTISRNHCNCSDTESSEHLRNGDSKTFNISWQQHNFSFKTYQRCQQI